MYICIHTHTGKKSRNLYQLHGYSRTRLEPQAPSPGPSPSARRMHGTARPKPNSKSRRAEQDHASARRTKSDWASVCLCVYPIKHS